jgi:tetratricopeptide (TPR) repeat protein
VEIWFSKIERDVIARGVFTSVADLARKLRKYIRAYGKAAALSNLATILREVRETNKNLNKEDSPNLAAVLTHLGVLYGDIGRHREAEPSFQRAIEIYQRLLGPEHPRLSQLDVRLRGLSAHDEEKDEAKKLEAYIRERRNKNRLQNPSAGNVVDVSSLLRQRSH